MVQNILASYWVKLISHILNFNSTVYQTPLFASLVLLPLLCATVAWAVSHHDMCHH